MLLIVSDILLEANQSTSERGFEQIIQRLEVGESDVSQLLIAGSGNLCVLTKHRQTRACLEVLNLCKDNMTVLLFNAQSSTI